MRGVCLEMARQGGGLVENQKKCLLFKCKVQGTCRLQMVINQNFFLFTKSEVFERFFFLKKEQIGR